MKFNIPLEGANVKLYTLPSKELIANRYERIVIGKRGPYIEIPMTDMLLESLFLPDKERWRLHSPTAYYLEFRTLKDKVMVYYQKRTVTYADYSLDMFYISPKDLTTKSIPVIR
jgi:hypothetical protein